MGVLVHFNIHPEFPFFEMAEAMEVVEESADNDATVIWGTTTDESLPLDYVKITIVATGFEKELSNNEDFVPETPAEAVAPRIKVRPRLVVGGELDHDTLDITAYMRQQQE
jgi:cell division protein FtsZ